MVNSITPRWHLLQQMLTRYQNRVHSTGPYTCQAYCNWRAVWLTAILHEMDVEERIAWQKRLTVQSEQQEQ